MSNIRNIGIEFPAPKQMQFYDLGSPKEVGETQILIRTRYSGITNGTERHALMADFGWSRFPGRHGYQHVGQVEAIGGEVKAFKAGDWVYYGRYVGHRGWHIQDVSGDYVDIHSNNSHLCIALPSEMDYKQCALLGVASVSMRAVRRCRVAPAQNVWVAGAGLIGQFAAQAARSVGAYVTVTDVNESRLAIAQKLGARRVISNSNGKTFKECFAPALQDGGPYDCIIDACGVESLFLDIHEAGLLSHGGVIGSIAVRSRAVFPWSMLHSREASIEVSCHYSLDDLRVVLHFVRGGVIQIEPLISHCALIDQAPVIYEMLRDRPGELLGVIFDWS